MAGVREDSRILKLGQRVRLGRAGLDTGGREGAVEVVLLKEIGSRGEEIDDVLAAVVVGVARRRDRGDALGPAIASESTVISRAGEE